MDLSTVTAHETQRQRVSRAKGRWQRILVVIDPTRPAQVALEKAARIALAHGSALELYVCDVQQELPESWAGNSRGAEYREILHSRAMAELQALAEPLRADGLTVTTRYEWHAPLEQGIGYHVIRTQPDLVVKETHAHPMLSAALGSRTDWNLIRQLPASLLLVRPGSWSAAPRVAAAVDPLHPADRPVLLDEAIVQTGHALAGMLHGSLDVLHVVQSPPRLPEDQVTQQQRTACEEKALDAVEKLAGIAQVPSYYATGNVAQGLITLTREHAVEVLVIGAVSRVRSPHATPGGEAARVLEQLTCDLLVVKPPGFVSPLLVTAD